MIADGLWSGTESCICALDLDKPFRVRVSELDGLLRVGADEEPTTDMYVVLQLWSNGRPLGPTSYTERCKSANAATGRHKWDDWVEFPLLYSDLPLDTLLCLTVWSSLSPVPVGGTTTHVFSTRGQLKRGMRRLRLHEGVEADGCDVTATPGKIEEKTFLHRAEKVRLEHQLSNSQQIRWLDVLSNKAFTELSEKAQRSNSFAAATARGVHGAHSAGAHGSSSSSSESMVTMVLEYPMFKLPVHHSSLPEEGDDLLPRAGAEGLVTVRDPEINTGLDMNPCEAKAAKVMKSLHAVVALSRKPNAAEYARIQAILKERPFAPPTADDGDLLWRFRHYLKENEIGFTKFMRSVDWKDEQEVATASKLISGWGGLTLQDCLEILSAPFKGLHAVRFHAVERLRKESTQTLIDILLQLVQALRYEDDALASPLMQLMCERASDSMQMCSYFYWYATVETTVETDTPAQEQVVEVYKGVVAKLLDNVTPHIRNKVLKQREFMDVLARIQQECSSAKTTTNKQERAVNIVREGGCGVAQLFGKEKAHHDPVGNKSGLFAAAKQKIMHNLTTAAPSAAPTEDGHDDEETPQNAKVTSPLFPDVELTGCRHEGIQLFTSAKTPMALSFNRTEPGKTLRIMYKAGDDIRQDQLVLQLIAMMDKLLTQDGLDLKITPYRVLATSVDDGLLEMVGETTQLQSIFRNIRGYLRQHNYDEHGEFKLTKQCLDNWVRSNAGYAIITFILGIGDRHLQNLLVTQDGKLLHIDFGFILGRDPKPFPPPLKLRKQMVDAMGGTDSDRFKEFKKLCCSAFNIIRKHSALILNAMAMMIDANIPDITADLRTTRDPYNKIRLVEEKMRLDLNDQDATAYFLQIIDEAINSIFGKLGDWAHQKAAGLRA